MPYKVVCKTNNTETNYDDCLDAALAVQRHKKNGCEAYVLPIKPSTYESYHECLYQSGAFSNSVFRIDRKIETIGLSPSNHDESINENEELVTTKSLKTDFESQKSKSQSPPKKDARNFYFEKLIKLVPAEIIALYLALHPLASYNGQFDESWSSGISIVCFVLVFVSRVFGTKITGYNTMKYLKTAQWGAITISAISFVIWVYAIGNKFAGFPIEDERIIQAAVILWTFIVPIVYNGEK
ncbi:hypothetical protein [Tenacibaculum jejuense]|uniref:Uncharacterized protein n=1 Tax=Tenacibaculum jejuense TaxID=584609 RepID=A0A238UCJ5_9FLAO|nr:hypothetical protein [Tenacibaculum jejuense]SNR16130.1 Probable transmembrane protein of unknown function [Tenacibaculum jejuense]